MLRGFAAPFLLIGVLLLIGLPFGYFFFNRSSSAPLEIIPQVVEKSNNLQTYSDQTLGFEFSVEESFKVQKDSEEEFNIRGNGNFRKNFRSFVGFEPGKFLGAVAVLDESNSFDTNPLTIWVFDNPQDLSIEKWYANFWYFPFVWGDFTFKGRADLAPADEATIFGLTTKSRVVTYQPGQPKFVYLPHQGKMYLFRIIGEGEKILESFKLLDDETAGWEVFSTSEYSIKHPSDFKYSQESYEGVGGEVTIDYWYSPNESKISIYSYPQDVESNLEFNLIPQQSTTYLAGEVLKKLTSEDGKLIHVGPINNYSINYMFIYSGKKDNSSIFDLMLSTFKFSR